MDLETTFISQYSPQWTKPEVLEEILVQRQDLLADSVEKIRESILTGNKHHLLFVGPRGAGKTHLVTLIHHRLQDEPLLERARFAWLNEDEIATSFLKLLVLIYRCLSERYPDQFSSTTLAGLMGKDPATAEEILGRTLLRELGEGRTLVLLVENLDALFKHLESRELLRWRAFIQNHPVFATVATAQALIDEMADQRKPFFGFFDTHHLQPLSVADARQLLVNVAERQGKPDLLKFLESPVGKARVSAIHDLAGGNPRLYLIFSEFLDRERLDNLVRPFEEMVDRQLTSYYQERLRWLSPQQREIIQLLCHQGRPIPVKQIAEGLFTTHNSITGQLKTLRAMRYVKTRKRGREVFYELAEPLMRLAIQVKETHDRKPLALIVDFLRVWHDRDEIERHLNELPPDSRCRAYFNEALELIDSGEPNLRHEILRRRLESSADEQGNDETLNTALCLATETASSGDWLKVGEIYNTRQEWDDAIQVFTKVVQSKTSTDKELVHAALGRGYSFGRSERIGEAISDFTLAINSLCVSSDELARALFNRGNSYIRKERAAEALADLTRVVELRDVPIEVAARALNLRGTIFIETNQLDKAVGDFRQVLESYRASAEVIGKALSGMGYCFYSTGDHRAVLETLACLLAPRRSKGTHDIVGPLIDTYATASVEAILKHSSDPKRWDVETQKFLHLFTTHDALHEIAGAIVRNLPALASSPLKHSAYDTWADVWSEAVAKLPAEEQDHFTIPLRLLRAGIEYLKSKDEGALLVLASEERKILREILALPPEEDQ